MLDGKNGFACADWQTHTTAPRCKMTVRLTGYIFLVLLFILVNGDHLHLGLVSVGSGFDESFFIHGNNSHEAFHFRNTSVGLTLQGWVIKKVPIVCNLIRNLQKILSLSFTEYNSITINFQLNLRGSLSLCRKWYETIAIVLSSTFCTHTRLLLPVISKW